MDRKQLGTKIRGLRKAKGWKQPDLERYSGVSERSIQEIEAGKGNPGIDHIELIGRALGSSTAELFGASRDLQTLLGAALDRATSLQEIISAWDAAAASPEQQTIGLLVLTLDQKYLDRLSDPKARELFQAYLRAAKRTPPKRTT